MQKIILHAKIPIHKFACRQKHHFGGNMQELQGNQKYFHPKSSEKKVILYKTALTDVLKRMGNKFHMKKKNNYKVCSYHHQTTKFSSKKATKRQ